MKQHLLIGALLTVVGGAGVLWQVDQATGPGAAAAQPAALLCPLGGHGSVPARLKDPFSASAASSRSAWR